MNDESVSDDVVHLDTAVFRLLQVALGIRICVTTNGGKVSSQEWSPGWILPTKLLRQEMLRRVQQVCFRKAPARVVPFCVGVRNIFVQEIKRQIEEQIQAASRTSNQQLNSMLLLKVMTIGEISLSNLDV